jgi:GxxExxY protein
MLIENDLATRVIGCALRIHRNLGPGLLESAYKECLFYELRNEGFYVQKEISMPLVYGDVVLECGYRLDLFVERKLIIEAKSVEALNDVHTAQVLTYLRLSGAKLGLLINFNVTLLKDGIRRIIRTTQP